MAKQGSVFNLATSNFCVWEIHKTFFSSAAPSLARQAPPPQHQSSSGTGSQSLNRNEDRESSFHGTFSGRV